MKISAAIKKLQELQNMYGDLKLVTDSHDAPDFYEPNFELDEESCTNHGKKTTIKARVIAVR